jgi:hypothetical protein
MRNDEYRRLHEACLAMAKQAIEQKMRDRWSAMAEAWLKRATELHEPTSDGVEGHARFGRTPGHRAAMQPKSATTAE